MNYSPLTHKCDLNLKLNSGVRIGVRNHAFKRTEEDWNKIENPLNQRFRGFSDRQKCYFVRPPGLEPGTKRL